MKLIKGVDQGKVYDKHLFITLKYLDDPIFFEEMLCRMVDNMAGFEDDVISDKIYISLYEALFFYRILMDIGE